MFNKLEKSILITINYFDVIGYAPTNFEVWKYIVKCKVGLNDVITSLDELIRKGELEMKNGFYFLPGKSHLVDLRQVKHDVSEKFWDRAILAAKILNWLPFIKMIAVANSLAFFNCDKKSDIDFFIITEKRKIWTTRAFSALLLHVLGLRRHGKKIAKRICLSFYISEEKMNLQYTVKPENELFMAFWIAGQAPIINHKKTFEKYKEENAWVKEYLPNANNKITNYYLNFEDWVITRTMRKISNKLFLPRWVESVARFVQIRKIGRTQIRLGNPQNIMFNDYILKFHQYEWKRESGKDWSKLMEGLK